MTERAAIYARVSTAGQEDERTIDSQLHDCRAYCERNGFEIVEEFTDEAVSGTIAFEERPAGRRLLEAAQAKQFERTIVYCVDRLSRDLGASVDAYRRLAKLSAPADFVLQSFDDTPEGVFQFNIFSAVAQYELSGIRRRTMQGRQRKVRDEGKWMSSRRPYGYDFDAERHLVVNEAEAQVVRDVFDWAVAGLGLNVIAAKLNDAGVTFSDRVGKYGVGITSIAKLLHARRYIGQATYGSTREPMTCPAIVDQATFDAAQDALTERQKHAPRSTKNEYLLQHRIVCGVCGANYTAETTRCGKKIYACRERRIHGKAAGHVGAKWRWDAEKLDNVAKAWVRTILTQPRVAASTMTLIVEDIRKQAGEADVETGAIRTRLAGLDEQDKRLIDFGVRGVLTERDMVGKRNALRAERNGLNDRLRALAPSSSIQDGVEEMLVHLKEVVEAARALDMEGGRLQWPEPDDDEWAGYVKHFIKHITINADGTVNLSGTFTMLDWPAAPAAQPQSVLANPQS